MREQLNRLGVTGGVDTHSRVHVAAVLDSCSQQLLGVQSFPVTTVGYAAMLTWFRRHGPFDAVGIEGTGTYGAGPTRHLTGG